MAIRTFHKRTRVDAPASDVFAWHARHGALERLTPPWDQVEVLERTGGIDDGGSVVLRVSVGPFSLRWTAKHTDYREGEMFRDEQQSGPFARWSHTHLFEPDGPSSSYLIDQIEYELPFGSIGSVAAGRAVKSRLKEMFSYRHRLTEQDVALLAKSRVKPLRIVISGATGLIGSSLIPFLTTAGHEVVTLGRSNKDDPNAGFTWDPKAGELDPRVFEGADAVVHLAGETIEGRWSEAKKARIADSRTQGTSLLAEALARLDSPPGVLIASSAVGYYGNRGDENLTEDSAPGSGFLADVCKKWEEATAPAAARGIRVVNLRTAPVLTPRGGPLSRLLTPFRFGLGGPVGGGSQYFPWISIDDIVGVIYHAIATDWLSGPVNAVAPEQVTNRALAKILGRVLGRPALMPLPAFAVRLAFGKMGEELLLSGQRVVPNQLIASGYDFRFPFLEGALRHLLGRSSGDD